MAAHTRSDGLLPRHRGWCMHLVSTYPTCVLITGFSRNREWEKQGIRLSALLITRVAAQNECTDVVFDASMFMQGPGPGEHQRVLHPPTGPAFTLGKRLRDLLGLKKKVSTYVR